MALQSGEGIRLQHIATSFIARLSFADPIRINRALLK